jgi:hypothetical protein
MRGYECIERERLPYTLLLPSRGLSLFSKQDVEIDYADDGSYNSWMLPLVIDTYFKVKIDADELSDCIHREYIDTMWFFNKELIATHNLTVDTEQYDCDLLQNDIIEELRFRCSDIIQELCSTIAEFSPLPL